MSIARSVAASAIAKPIATALTGMADGYVWSNTPPDEPSIANLTIRSMWQVPYGNEMTLKDVVGNNDLNVVAGGPMTFGTSPGGKPSVYFDGTLELTAESLGIEQNVGVALFLQPDEDDDRDYCGFGSADGACLSMGSISGAGGSSNVKRHGSTYHSAYSPTMHFFAPFFYQGIAYTYYFANGNGGAVASMPSTSLTGFSLGGRFPGGGTNNRFVGQLLGAIVFESTLSDYTSVLGFHRLLAQYFFSLAVPVAAAGQKIAAFSGDSISVGSYLANNHTPPAKVKEFLPRWTVYSVGGPGASTASNIANDPYLIDPNYSATRERHVAILLGEPSNQIQYGGDAAACMASLDTWGTARKAAGLQAIVCTVLDRSSFDGGMNTIKGSVNTSLRAAFNVATSSSYVFRPAGGTTYADFLVDIAAIPGVAFVDGIHPDTATAELIAREIETALDQYDKVQRPLFSVPTKRFSVEQSVVLTCGTSGAAIYYTTDGSAPNATKTLYSGPIAVTTTTTIKAIGIKGGLSDSDIVAATYTYAALQEVAIGWTTGTGTVVDDTITLGGFGENGYGTAVIDATEDFQVVAQITSSFGGLVLALDSEVGATTWGSGDTHYSGISLNSNFPDPTYDVNRVYSSGTATEILTAFTAPIQARIRKVGNDVLIDTSADGITWTNRDTRVGTLDEVTTCRVKVYAISSGTVEAVIEILA